jgi:hypothetical protein
MFRGVLEEGYQYRLWLRWSFQGFFAWLASGAYFLEHFQMTPPYRQNSSLYCTGVIRHRK